MNDIKDQFKLLKDELVLKSEERSNIQVYLENLTEEVPTVVANAPALPSPYLTFFTQPRAAFAFMLALLVIGGSSVTSAAEKALPGEALYPIKISVNERFERATALSTLARADVEIQHAEERLREVELLVASGNEDVRTVEEVALQVEERVLRADEYARSLSDEGQEVEANRIHARIASALSAHADILRAQSEEEEDEKKTRLRALSVAISFAAKDVDDSNESENEDKNEDYALIASTREEHVREGIEELTKVLNETTYSSEVAEELRKELASIEAQFGEARGLIATEDYEEAGKEYEAIEQRAYLAKALLTSAQRINDKTGKNVFIRFDGREEARTAKQQPQEDAAVMFMATVAEDSSNEDNDSDKKDDDESESKLRFWVDDDEDHDSDNSGHGSDHD